MLDQAVFMSVVDPKTDPSRTTMFPLSRESDPGDDRECSDRQPVKCEQL